MKVSKDYLGNILNAYIKKNFVKNRKEFKNRFIEVSSDCGLDIEIIADILNNSKIALESISVKNLYILTKSVITINNENKSYKVTNDINDLTNLKDYFTNEEIEQMEKTLILYKEDLKNNNQDKIIEELLTFENVLRVSDDQFIAVIPLKKYLSLYDNNLVKYNTITQRDTKKSLYENTIIESIDINFSQVKDITDLVIKGNFIANTITLNVLQDETKDTIIYDADNNLLKINGEINILDGFHRTLGYQNAYLKSDDIDMNIELRITNFNILKARRFIVQEDKQRKMNLDHIERLKDTYINKLFKVIKEDTDFGNIITKGKVSIPNTLTISDTHIRNVLNKIYSRELNSDMEVNIIKSQVKKFLTALYFKLSKKYNSNKLYEYEFANYIFLFKSLMDNKLIETLNEVEILEIINFYDSSELYTLRQKIKHMYYNKILTIKDIKNIENDIIEKLKNKII